MPSDMPSCLKVEKYSQEYQISGGHILWKREQSPCCLLISIPRGGLRI